MVCIPAWQISKKGILDTNRTMMIWMKDQIFSMPSCDKKQNSGNPKEDPNVMKKRYLLHKSYSISIIKPIRNQSKACERYDQSTKEEKDNDFLS